MLLLIERCSEKYVKKLIGRTDLEDALKRLDQLTHEEARMGIAQNLRATQNVGESVRRVVDTVASVDDRVRMVDDKVAEVNRGV
jgi:Tfp pilus assembly PilM family ATPase